MLPTSTEQQEGMSGPRGLSTGSTSSPPALLAEQSLAHATPEYATPAPAAAYSKARAQGYLDRLLDACPDRAPRAAGPRGSHDRCWRRRLFPPRCEARGTRGAPRRQGGACSTAGSDSRGGRPGSRCLSTATSSQNTASAHRGGRAGNDCPGGARGRAEHDCPGGARGRAGRDCPGGATGKARGGGRSRRP